MSRDFAHEHKITTRSVWEINDALDQVVRRAGRRLKFRGRKLSREAVVNGAIVALSGMDADALVRFLAPHVAAIEAMLGRDAPPEADDPPGPLHGERAPVAPPPRSRRSG